MKQISILNSIKNKKNKKIKKINIQKIFSLLLVFSIITTTLFFQSNNSIVNAEEYKDNQALITGIIVNSITDGSGNFDANDNAGNDSSNNNRIVRTYDTVRYAVEYTLNMRPNSPYDSFESAYVNVEMSIQGDKGDVEFVTGEMPWLEKAQTTYSNGNIIVTGKTLIKRNNGVAPIPGTQGLNIVLKPKAIKSGSILKPTFKLWLDGNDESEKQSIICDDSIQTADGKGCAVRTSSAPNLDIRIVSELDAVRYASLTNNTIGYDTSFGNIGLASNFGIVVMMNSSSVQKGIMGVEEPDGPISFDMDFSGTITPRGGSTSTITAPTNIWDYKNCNENLTGNLGRKMNWYMWSASSVSIPTLNATTRGCEKPGNYSVSPLGNNKYRVTISDYEITNHFPTQNGATQGSGIIYHENEKIFSAGKIQAFTEIPETITDITDYRLTANISNINYKSQSGNTVTTETNMSNNSSTNTFARYLTGSYWKGEYFWGNINIPTSGTASGVIRHGETLTVDTRYSISDTSPLSASVYAVNHMVKFDDKAYEPLADAYRYFSQQDGNIKPDINQLFAAKKDGTGWASEDELQTTRMTQLDFYKSLDELKSAGKVCVGVLIEERNGYMMPGTGGDYNNCRFSLKIKKDAPTNQVYISTNDVYMWREKAKNWSLNDSFSNPNWSYVTPDVTLETANTYPKYYKSEFSSEGEFIKNHTDVSRGQCVYVVGETNSITKGFDQTSKTSSGSTTPKTTYNLNFSERQVDFYIQPKVTTLSNNGKTTTITIVDRLPKWLHYIENSSVLGGEYVEATDSASSYVKNGTKITPKVEIDSATGETILTYTIENVTPNVTIDRIHYSATIGDSSNPLNDVEETNNPISTTTYMYSKYGAKTSNITTSLNVIKSVSTSLSKSVKNKYIEKNGDLTFSLSFGNSSQNNTRPFSLYDILPYNNDDRGSKFDGTTTCKTVLIKKENSQNTINQNIRLYYTADTNIRNNDNAKLLNDANNNWIEVSRQTTSDGLLFTINKDITGLKITGDSLIALEALNLDINMGTSNNNKNDTYVNRASVYADRFADTVFSNKVNVTVVNRKISGNVFEDKDKNNYISSKDKNWKNIKVTLVKEDGSQATDVLGNKINDVTTDENGYYEFEDLAAGKYYIQIKNENNKQISNDYDLISKINYDNQDKVKYLDIDTEATKENENFIIKSYKSNVNGKYQDNDISFATADKMMSATEEISRQNFGFANYKANITVEKTLKQDDIWWDFGNPTFIFKIDGTSYTGEKIVKYVSLEFNKENTSDQFNQNKQNISLSKTITLPCGNYTVSEVNVSRYEFESASAENGSVDGQNVNLNVFEENKAKASFTNKINNYQFYSHRSIKVNHVK